MTDYPKEYVKGDRKRIAHSTRDEVKLQFDGYRVATAKPETTVPELTEGQMSLLPEALDAEVVDLTEETPGPKPRDQRKN